MRKTSFQASHKVLASSLPGPIIEICFSGEDDVSRGSKICQYLEKILEEHSPVALLLNFVECRQFFDADMGSIISAFFDKDRDRHRPCAVLAKGRTARSVRTLLDLTTLNVTFDVKLFKDRDSAVAHLHDSQGT